MAKLTAKQEKFAQAIALENMNQADAYRSAYNTERMAERTVWDKAYLLAKKDEVRARVAELRQQAMTPKVMTAQKRKERLTEIIDDPDIDINAKLKAIDLLNKMDGEYVQKVEAKVENEVTINVELVDDDE